MSKEEQFARLYRGFTQRYGRFTIEGREDSGKYKGKAQTLDKAVTPADYAAHLAGEYGIGIIPLLDDNTVHFAAIDLDEYPGSEKFKINRKDEEKVTEEERQATLADEIASVEARDKAYQERVEAAYREWINRIVLNVKQEPLLATKSKSGGLHLWYFSDEGVLAPEAINYLKEIAHRIGHAGCEIFPKQATRHSQTDVGNWINLPFFGDTRPAVCAIETKTGYDVREITFEQWLPVAVDVARANTQASLERLNKRLADTGPVTSQEWYDGPPCLQRLIIGDPKKVEALQRAYDKKVKDSAFKDEEDMLRAGQWLEKQKAALVAQLADGGRDTTFFNVSMYIARREFSHFKGQPSEGLREKIRKSLGKIHDDWKHRSGNKGLDFSDIERLSNQGAKDGWNYTCNQPPLKSHCDRKTCLNRPFGIGSKDDDVKASLDGFTKVLTTPPYYAFNINSCRVAMDSATLLNQFKFQVEVLEQAGVVWTMLPAAKFTELLSDSINSATEVDGPPEVGDVVVIATHLMNYLERNRIYRGSGQESKFKTPGKALWTEDSSVAWFKLTLFHEYLITKRFTMNIKVLQVLLHDKLKVTHKATSLMINGKSESVNPYVVNIPELVQVIEHG